jgi:crotonobetainyl-CoA:carnitine CoA-transferase CaiB-like acyl-CoA transferase
MALKRNKASLVVDLKREDGLAQAHELIRTADVVMESFKPGGADRLGIGYEQARALRPDVVYLSISGFGQTGPLRARPGYDQLLQAYVGHMSVTGEPDRPSVRIGPSAIDLLTGAHAACGVLLALRERDRTGEGQHVETSLYDSSVSLVSHIIADYTGSGRVPGKVGGDFAFLAPYGMFQARDREFYMGVGSDRMYAALCRAIERPDLASDPRFARNGERIAHRAELNEQLAPVFRTRDGEEWVSLCTELGIPASLVSTIPEVVEQEQAHAREMIVDTGVDGVRTAGLPIKLSRTPASIRRPPPHLGDACA